MAYTGLGLRERRTTEAMLRAKMPQRRSAGHAILADRTEGRASDVPFDGQ